MSLTSALRTATSSLKALQTQTAVSSTNIANAGTTGATRVVANLTTTSTGTVVVSSITQAQNASAFAKLSATTASVAGASAIADGLDRLYATVGDTNSGVSPAAKINDLAEALTDLKATPGSYDLARVAAAAASDLASTLKSASDAVLDVRQTADQKLATAAKDMNSLLSRIETLNKQIVAGTASGQDVTAMVDQRSNAIVSLSEYTGVIVNTRENNDVALYTDSGVTLFDVSARKVEFETSTSLDASVGTGAVFRVDGVVVAGENALMPLVNGSVVGLMTLRDELAPAYQTQLDELARSLVAAFSESSNGLPDMTGLFGSLAHQDGVTAPLGTYSAGTMALGDELSFTFTYNDETYTARHVVDTVPMTSAAYEAALQNAVNTAVTASGKAFGTSKVSVDVSATGAITMTPQGAGLYMGFAVTSVSARGNDGAKDGGLVPAAPASGTGTATAGTAATISAGTFAAGTIGAGDTITFDLAYNGATYRVTQTFASPPSAAEFQANLQAAINTAVAVPGGKSLGAGKVTASVDAGTGAISLASVTKGSDQSLALSRITASDATPDYTKTGGLVQGSVPDVIRGLASALVVSKAVSLDPQLLRDGGINGMDYSSNAEGADGFNGRLNALVTSLNAQRSFASASGTDPNGSITDFATSSVAWINEQRSKTNATVEYQTTLLTATQASYSSATGINMDEELTRLIEIERSYQASSKILSTVDEMFASLFQSVG